MTPEQWYRQACLQQNLVADGAQLAAIEELQALWLQLVEFKNRRNRFLGRSLLSPEVPKGLYIWGGVGRGKTFLMDGFYRCLPYRRKRRIHFHGFIAEVHQRMKLLGDADDPLIALADEIAVSTRLLCLDELHVDDIADAMILGRLFSALFSRGVVLLTTSNYPPDGLYPDGLQRQNFLPAIELIKREMKVLHFEGENDYRRVQRERDPVFVVSDDAKIVEMFARMASGRPATPVGIGRMMAKGVADDAVWFNFCDLCGENLDQSDYLQIADRFSTLLLSDVPKMSADNAAATRRFTWLIDVLYDNSVRLVANFAVSPENLFDEKSPESIRIESRLAQMQSRDYLEMSHLKLRNATRLD